MIRITDQDNNTLPPLYDRPDYKANCELVIGASALRAAVAPMSKALFNCIFLRFLVK